MATVNRVYEAKVVSQWLNEQPIRVYEIRFSTWKDGDKWRKNHTALVAASTMFQALDAIREHWTDNLVIHQAIHRNDQMHVVFCGGV